MLNYRVYGELNQQRPLLVLHGLLGALDNWHTFAKSQEGKRPVIALDLRNHGSSPHVSGMSYQEMVSDVQAILTHLAIADYDLMGHSMGGKTAMVMALQQAQRLQRLIVVDIAPRVNPPRHQALLQSMLTMPLAEIKNRKQADEWLMPVVNHPFERGFLLKNLGRRSDGSFYWQCNLTEIVRNYLKICGFPQLEAQFNAPTLFIRGGQSDYIQNSDWPAIQQQFPNAHLNTIESAGHLPHVQTPAEFIALVEHFLN